jgi:hypothetical protein
MTDDNLCPDNDGESRGREEEKMTCSSICDLRQRSHVPQLHLLREGEELWRLALAGAGG